jgi:ribosomal protein L37E
LPDEEVAETLEDGDTLLEQYAEMMMQQGYITDMSTSVMAWGSSRMSEGQQVLYYTLKSAFEEIIKGDGSGSYINTKLINEKSEETDGEETVVSAVDSPISFTFKELDIEDWDMTDDENKGEAMTKAFDQLDFKTVMNLLLMDMPYELYWYDKTTQAYSQAVGKVDADKKTVTIESIRIVMPVSEDYRDGTAKINSDVKDSNGNAISYYKIDTSKIKAANAAAENAQKIIADVEGKSDYEKLLAFKGQICELVSYDHTAAASDAKAYGDPWQMIYVFDGDTDTNVVCEGYAKAFQYLCDNGGLSADTVCYTVTGKLYNASTNKDVNHMWNIVKIGDKSYLVDVTNSDENTVGDDGELFLAGAAGSVDEGYSVTIGNSTLKYTYDADTKKLDPKSEILALSDSNYEAEQEETHVHSYQWKYDDTEHWQECECGDVTAKEEHSYLDDSLKCVSCGYEKSETEPEHVAGDAWQKDPNYHWHLCTVKNHDDILDKEAHNYVSYLPTTDEPDTKHTAHCDSNCGAVLTEEHDWQEDSRTEPTVTEKGSITYKCSKCDRTKTEEIPSLSESHEHVWDSWGGDDSYHWKECKAEGCYVSDNSDKDSYGEHQWDEGTVTKEATEEEAGVRTYTCAVCGQTKTEQIPVISKHNWGNTYSHDSKTHWLECSDSSCNITDNKDKSGYGEHSFGAYRVISAATATTNGLMQHTCLVCGYSESSTIPASGVADTNHTHSWGSWQFTSPNYWERTCSTCGNREINVVNSSTTTTTGTTTKYTMTSGANQTWLRGNGTKLTFTANIPFSEFGLVKLNGVELPSSYYTASEGSTVITLNDNCTSELSTGVHTIAIYSKYGDVVETNFMVQNASTTGSTTSSSNYAWASPKTGDSADMGLWVTVMAISLLGMTAAAAVVIKKGKRE